MPPFDLILPFLAPITSLISGLVVSKLKDFYANRRYVKLTRADLNVLSGRWRGYSLQEVSGQIEKHSITVDLDIKDSKRVFGRAIVVYSEAEKGEMAISGGFFLEGGKRFLLLEYKNEHGIVLQFGSIILLLSDTGRSFSGKVMGYGPRTGTIVTGTIEFVKDDRLC